jgi:hypothetical protein
MLGLMKKLLHLDVYSKVQKEKYRELVAFDQPAGRTRLVAKAGGKKVRKQTHQVGRKPRRGKKKAFVEILF